MTTSKVNAFEIIEERDVKDLNSKGYLMRHKKTGARVFILSNDDDNKVFYIAFRTPPKDDTGLPHILEHSVLCGSKKYPLKDPFVELVKGSLNTFLNAMTYPDKTVYPVASCNEKDFQNLMNVYMDAVFFPNIYQREEIFMQEGWSYSLEKEEDDIEYNGVVYNEMKGAFSSPEGVLDREILHELFPDTCYSYESGGNPKNIPELEYSDFLNFHKQYYHPSNSYIYLYGNMNVEEKLEWLDREYLSHFDKLAIDSEIKLQKPFNESREARIEYPISSTESERDNTYLSYNTVVDTALNQKLYLAFQAIEYALISMPGAPLKKALLDAGIGKDILGSYDNGVLQPFFSITAKNANEERKEEFVSIIKNKLEDIVKTGIDKDSLRAGLNSLEFKYREADFGHYPKGLMYGLQAMDSWLHDESDPFMHIEALATFEFLKNQIETDYYENLIEKYLVDNKHSVLLILAPKKGLNDQAEKELADKLKAFKESLSTQQIKELVQKTKRLEEYQSEPSTKEELETIPLLTREDIAGKPEPFYNTEKEIEGIKVLHHDLFTNGIAYIELIFRANDIPMELIPYLGVLKTLLGYMDTKKHSYTKLSNEINIHTGGISAGTSLYTDANDNDKYMITLDFASKVLYDKIPYAVDLMKEILFATEFDDTKRLYEIIAELKSKLQMGLNSGGHSAAALRAMSYYSSTAYIRELVNGIEFYKLIEKFEKNFDKEKGNIIYNIKQLLGLLLNKENLTVSVICDAQGYEKFSEAFKSLAGSLKSEPKEKFEQKFRIEQLNEGFKTSAQIQYVARAGNFIDKGYAYTGVLKILKVIMNYEYLWQNIRVKGGAYGCMSNYTRNGDCYFVSYRDPNLKKTNDIYNGIADFLRNFTVDDRDMTKFIIGTISDLDVPLNPLGKGQRSLSAYFSNIRYEDILKEREQILHAGCKEIRDTADLIQSVLDENYICVIGNENKIDQDKSLFKNTLNLYD